MTTMLGWHWNDGERQTFKVGEDDIVIDGDLALAGNLKDMLIILGVDLPTAAYSYNDKVHDKTFVKAKNQIRRVRIGVLGEGIKDRVRRKLVLPKLVWGAHWFRPCFATLRKWDNMIEKCVNGRVLMRSPVLGMAALGAKNAPSFLITYRTLQYEQRRLR